MTLREIPVAAAAALMLAGGMGCGGELTPAHPSGIDGEGLPLMAALPEASGTCTITNPPYRAIETASWDAPTRTFTMSGLYWRLDERGRAVEHGQTGGEWRDLMTRDEHGVLTAFTYEWQGAAYADNSYDQTNSYDGDGRLTASVLVFRSGARQASDAYQYDGGGRLIGVTSVGQDAELTAESWTKFYWSNGRLITRERGSGSLLRGRDTRYYHDDGRLGTIDIVGGDLAPDVDGYIDLRQTWSYDGAGRLLRHEEYSAEDRSPPVIDSVPDSVTAFDDACAAIAVLPLELYQLESWVRLP